MSANSFGQRLSMSTFGESHGLAMGVLIDGFPSGVLYNESLLKSYLRRRRPGLHSPQGGWVSDRQEEDMPEILSGLFEKKTLGTPIAIVVRNQDARPKDYDSVRQGNFRIGHAEDLWKKKFSHWDYRGGGRASGRETLGRVLGGAFAHMFLAQKLPTFQVKAFVRQLAHFRLKTQNEQQKGERDNNELAQVEKLSNEQIYAYPGGFPSPSQSEAVKALLEKAKKEGESYGGELELWIEGVPLGLGQPVFHKLKADLTHALMGIGAIFSLSLGVEEQEEQKEEGNKIGTMGKGKKGSDFHFQAEDSKGKRYGGIRGGISTGERIVLRMGMKPPASLGHFARQGRHDPCILPRALAVVEAMSCFVLADHLLWKRQDCF